jgi:hypothetical protein
MDRVAGLAVGLEDVAYRRSPWISDAESGRTGEPFAGAVTEIPNPPRRASP